MRVRQLVHLFTKKLKSGKFCSVFNISLPKLLDIFSLTYLTDWPKQNLIFLLVCPSVGSFVHWKMEMCDILVCFQDNFTKIGRHLPLDPSHELAQIKFQFFVCVSVSWFICSVKPGKFGYFGKESWKNFSILYKIIVGFAWVSVILVVSHSRRVDTSVSE